LICATDEVRAQYLTFQPQAAGIAALAERVRQSFDPKHILNRGRPAREAAK
jgi:glycolate oxidase FAD binding subunit